MAPQSERDLDRLASAMADLILALWRRRQDDAAVGQTATSSEELRADAGAARSPRCQATQQRKAPLSGSRVGG